MCAGDALVHRSSYFKTRPTWLRGKFGTELDVPWHGKSWTWSSDHAQVLLGEQSPVGEHGRHLHFVFGKFGTYGVDSDVGHHGVGTECRFHLEA